MSVRVGSTVLHAPVMTAAGTAGHGAELGAYFPLADLGAVVVKSLSAEPWEGNPAPRVHERPGGMLNSVGLQGPGVPVWLTEELPELLDASATVVASIWGRSVEDFRRAADLLASAPAQVVAVEVNLSCPNLDGGAHLFAHSEQDTATVIEACAGAGRPLWAKLSPNTDRLVSVAAAAAEAGADAVTLTNTMMGMAIDIETATPVLGAGAGGLSGPAIHPIAVRAVHDVHRAEPDLAIIGAGGVATADDAIEFMMAGASAVQVGTATFADPRSVHRIQDRMRAWCEARGITSVSSLTGAAHRTSGRGGPHRATSPEGRHREAD